MPVWGSYEQGRQEDVLLNFTVSGSDITLWIIDVIFRRRTMGDVYFATSGLVVSGTLGAYQTRVPGYVFSGVDPVNYFAESWRNTSGTASFLAGDYVVLLPSTKRSG